MTSWHTGRGDTAGTATTGPDIIIEGTNGMIIGCGAERYKAKVNASISVDFLEQDWYHIPNTLFDIDARSFIGERPDFIGKKVSKIEFMQVINSIDRFLIRAKYHTDQLGMISHKKSLITIFSHKHEIKNFIKKFDTFWHKYRLSPYIPLIPLNTLKYP